MNDTPPAPSAKSAPTVSVDPSRIVDILGRFVAPTTLLVAVLAYFGLARTNSLYNAFGIKRDVLGLSTMDYVMNSSYVVIRFLTNILGAAVACAWAHFGVASLLHWKPAWRGFAAALLCLGGIVLLGIVYTQGNLSRIAMNSLWTLGVGLIGYALWLAGSLTPKRNAAADNFERAARIWPAFRRVNQYLFVGLLVVGMFVTVAWYAEDIGRGAAKAILDCPIQQPGVTVYSLRPLVLESDGVAMKQVSEEEGAYKYRYTGLRFLTRGSGKYFLIPESITTASPSVIILPDDNQIRVEMTAGGMCAASANEIQNGE